MGAIFRKLKDIILVPTAALFGNWLGGQLRYHLTGESVHTIQNKYTTRSGYQVSNTPVATKFYPSLVFAMFGKPHWLYALIGGILAGGFMPDDFERLLHELVFHRFMNIQLPDGDQFDL